jgi:hypothetical protein
LISTTALHVQEHSIKTARKIAEKGDTKRCAGLEIPWRSPILEQAAKSVASAQMRFSLAGK